MMLYRVPMLPVLICSIMTMAVGMVWYSPFLFGRTWMTLSGIDPDKADECNKKGMKLTYLASFLVGLFMSFLVGYVLTRTFSASLIDALKKAVLLWAGFVAPVLLGGVLWEKKPVTLYLINAGYYLVALSLISMIIVSMI